MAWVSNSLFHKNHGERKLSPREIRKGCHRRGACFETPALRDEEAALKHAMGER